MWVLAITTYNRLGNLQLLLESFRSTRTEDRQWMVVIADDGSTDGTIAYLNSLKNELDNVHILFNQRKGVHYQFNTIINFLEEVPFSICFKCDDDIRFLTKGWDLKYAEAIEQTGYDHLCFYDLAWRENKNRKQPVKEGRLISYCSAKDVQGAFFSLTPRVIREIGYMDTNNFGFRGVGHIDYTLRACRAGFNHPEHPFDICDSNTYIAHQDLENYTPALEKHLLKAFELDETIKIKYSLLEDTGRNYIPFADHSPSLTREMEYDLLHDRLDAMQREIDWYKEHYDHQPRWFSRIGKFFKIMHK